jgi:hypothetical protein
LNADDAGADCDIFTAETIDDLNADSEADSESLEDDEEDTSALLPTPPLLLLL